MPVNHWRHAVGRHGLYAWSMCNESLKDARVATGPQHKERKKMDDYGCYRNTKEDLENLSEHLKDSGSIVFAYSKDGMSAYVIMMTKEFRKLGTLPFGGNPNGSVLVSILGRGAFWFKLPSETLHPEYVGEKLNMTGEDAETVCELLLGLLK